MRLTVILLATIFVKSFQLVSAINDIELQQNHVRLKTIGFTNLLYNFVNSSQTIPQKVSTECWLSIKNTINDDNLSKKCKLKIFVFVMIASLIIVFNGY